MQKEIKNFITRKIGSTVYVVGVHFSDTSKENFNDKLLRLVKASVHLPLANAPTAAAFLPLHDEATANKCEVVTC